MRVWMAIDGFESSVNAVEYAAKLAAAARFG
jgi:hypothetical protein